jgi:hypothetical protein
VSRFVPLLGRSLIELFGLFRRRKEVIEASAETESGGGAEARIAILPTEALKDTVSDSENRNTVSLQASETVVDIDPPATVSDDEMGREAVVVLNVKAICDLAGFLPDRAKYENFRDQAMGMALSLQDGSHREFAVGQVVNLCRRSGEVHVVMELYDKVSDHSLRERILKSCPELRPLVFMRGVEAPNWRLNFNSTTKRSAT